MTPSPSINHYRKARHSCWLSASDAQARIGALYSPAVMQAILPRYAPIVRSHRRIPASVAPSRSRQPLQSKFRTPGFVVKSP
jgi:hypothetical protein